MAGFDGGGSHFAKIMLRASPDVGQYNPFRIPAAEVRPREIPLMRSEGALVLALVPSYLHSGLARYLLMMRRSSRSPCLPNSLNSGQARTLSEKNKSQNEGTDKKIPQQGRVSDWSR